MMESIETVWARMLSGQVYQASHPGLLDRLSATRDKLRIYNDLAPGDMAGQKAVLGPMLGSHGKNFHINQPFRCDYGCNIHIGENFFANFNLTILDEATVTIGDNAFIGPNVSIYTPCHPLDPTDRNANLQWAKPVTIGDNVWIGGDVTILPGTKIGDNVVIGAGSVVTKEIPSNVVAAGNPARIIKKIDC